MTKTTWQPVNLAFQRQDHSGYIDYLQVMARVSTRIPLAITPTLYFDYKSPVPTSYSPPYGLTCIPTGYTIGYRGIGTLREARRLLAKIEELSQEYSLTWGDYFVTEWGLVLPERYGKANRKLREWVYDTRN